MSRSNGLQRCLVALACTVPSWALAEGKACALITGAELESSLGGKATWGTPSTLPGGVDACSGASGPVTVTLRHFKRTGDPSGEKEKAGIEMMRKMGAKVEVQKAGPITCVALSPNAELAAYGFTTSCTAAKAPMFAVIEATSRTGAIPIDRLRPLAEKMLTRF